MKHLVIVTRDFPPFVGRGAVLRCLKFAKYLPDFNVRVTVLCEKKDNEEDASLLKELSEHVQIIPIENPSPRNIKNKQKKNFRTRKTLKNLMLLLFARIHDLFFQMRKNRLFPDEWIYLAKAMQRYIDHHNLKADAFLLSGPPFSMMTINTGTIPFFLDYRDAWSLNPVFDIKKNSKKIRKLESLLLRSSRKVLFASLPMIDDYKKTYSNQSEKLFYLPNGYDHEDIPFSKGKKLSKIRFNYNGTIGGTQKAKYFLEAIFQYLELNPSDRKKIEVHFVGVFLEDVNFWENRLKNIFYFHGKKAHKNSLIFLNNCDVAVWLNNKKQGGKTMVTGKLYEYLALKKPILASSSNCAGLDLLIDAELAYIAKENDTKDIQEQIACILEDWKHGSLKTMNENFDLNRFSRKRLSERLAKEMFNTLDKSQEYY